MLYGHVSHSRPDMQSQTMTLTLHTHCLCVELSKVNGFSKTIFHIFHTTITVMLKNTKALNELDKALFILFGSEL